ncbi:MAG: hypothetical protein K0Q97_123 [Bacillota bacterium]|jgi:signal transduction histidine kinase|nr:hypothetical protein [Bacillota bacterium]
MNLTAYDYIFTVGNIIHTYILFRFMCIFFDRNDINKKIEFLSYVFYGLIVTYIHLFVKLPIVTLLFNIISLFLLTLNYKSSLKKRILSPILIFILLVLVEIFVAALTSYSFTSGKNLSSISGVILQRILSYLVMLVMDNFKNVKKNIFISNIYWVSIFAIPLGTLVICFLLLLYIDIKPTHILISISILLFINIITFYLYDALNKSYEERIENILIKEQNNYYENQLNLMENSAKNVSSIRHDIKNHLFAISTYIKNNEKVDAINYISQIIDLSYGDREYAQSGNINIDSILNYKLLEAESKGISVSLELKIPTELSVDSFDMVVVLCNLLDNSIRASSKYNGDKKIDISMIYKTNILFIHIENTFDGNVLYDNSKIITTKEDKANHGIGLNNIQNVIDKYDGTLNINHNENKFSVDIIMYITEKLIVTA